MVLDGIDVFTEVVDAQSFTLAARRLSMPSSTVSARIARLEKRLGTTLIRRTTRQLSVTPAGQAYYNRCVRALAEMAAAEADIAQRTQTPSGQLTVAAPADIAQFKLVSVIDRYLETYPEVSIDLRVANAHIDLLAEDIDLAIRVADLGDSGLIVTRYASIRVSLWASRAYLDRNGIPETLAELGDHQIVGMSRANALLDVYDTTGELKAVNERGRIVSDDMQSCRAFIASGAGIGILPDFIGEHPDTPLVRVLPAAASDPVSAYFVYPAQRYLPRTVRAFIDLAKETEPR